MFGILKISGVVGLGKEREEGARVLGATSEGCERSSWATNVQREKKRQRGNEKSDIKVKYF